MIWNSGQAPGGVPSSFEIYVCGTDAASVLLLTKGVGYRYTKHDAHELFQPYYSGSEIHTTEVFRGLYNIGIVQIVS